ncbi:MAG: S49 family peptidase [Opitutales bacterium]|nr:S49 family peptidase [Opitutales bacterium]
METEKFLQMSFRAWNILPAAFLELCNREAAQPPHMQKGGAPEGANLDALREFFAPFVRQRAKSRIDESGIAHIEIRGALFQDEAPFIVAAYGGTGYDELLEDLKYAEKSARGIFLKINSPGGHASGNANAAKAFAASKLPVVVHAQDYCCSAAYAIASGANYIFANPDTLAGSIGTILPLLNEEALWEKLGIKPDYITNRDGILKASGMPPGQSALERQSLQLETESFFELFKSHVLKYRNIPSEAMRGQPFVGFKALENNLIDGIRGESAAYEKLLYLTKRQSV